jgi:hypothetical protein
LSAKAICASVNFDFFTVFRICDSVFPPENYPKNSTLQRLHFMGGGHIVHNLILVTRNIKDFERTGVNLVIPWDLI